MWNWFRRSCGITSKRPPVGEFVEIPRGGKWVRQIVSRHDDDNADIFYVIDETSLTTWLDGRIHALGDSRWESHEGRTTAFGWRRIEGERGRRAFAKPRFQVTSDGLVRLTSNDPACSTSFILRADQVRRILNAVEPGRPDTPWTHL